MRKNIRYLPWKERVKLYEEAMRLRKERGWGYVKIGRAIDVHHDVVRHWIHHGRNPMRHGRMKLWKPKPSPELAYIVGVYYGDADIGDRGRTDHRTRFIRLRVNHKEFAERFASCGAKVIGRKQNNIGRERKQYRVCLYSYYLCEFLRRPLKELKVFIEAYPTEFIKGLVDSEGSIVACPVKWDNWRWLSAYITITNCDIELLRLVKSLLEKHLQISSRIRLSYKSGSKVSFEGKMFYRKKDAYVLNIGRFRDLKIFSDEIDFTIIEKQTKLLDVIGLMEKYKKGSDRYNNWFSLYHRVNKRWVRKTL